MDFKNANSSKDNVVNETNKSNKWYFNDKKLYVYDKRPAFTFDSLENSKMFIRPGAKKNVGQ